MTMRVGRVACVMALATSAAWAQSRPCSSYESLSDCVGQRCENDVQYCVWNVAAESCGCPRSCAEYSGDLEPCINSVCPSLLPQQHVPCNYNYDTKKCWCPEAAETGAPATPAPPTSAPPTPAPPTSAPPTPAPATPAPPTSAPPTPAPPTSAPATPAPAPATSVPGTTLVPTTEAPEFPLCNETTLVLNPSFENISTTTSIASALEYGHMQSWDVSHGHPTVMGGAPGQGLRSAWMWSHSGAGEGIVTNVPFVNGQTYHVSMWVTTKNSVSGHFFVKAVIGLVTQNTIWPLPSFTGSEEMYSNGMVFPDWTEISFNYTATYAYTQLWIYPLWAGGSPQAQVQVDNIRVCAVETDAPATPAPPTSAPPTSAPPTPAPATPAPPTPAPPTSAPPTSAPPTSAPATPAPPTPAPSTSAPPTSAPPTSAPATPVPATPAPPTRPPVERCEDLNFQHGACINTLCPGFAWQSRRMYCKYNEKTGVCWCPEEVETKAPATPWPVISDDCSSFHGLPRTCMSSLCFTSGMRASCKYDYSSNLCLCA